MRSSSGHRPARAQLTLSAYALSSVVDRSVEDALMIMVSSGGLVLSLVQAASVRIDAIRTCRVQTGRSCPPGKVLEGGEVTRRRARGCGMSPAPMKTEQSVPDRLTGDVR